MAHARTPTIPAPRPSTCTSGLAPRRADNARRAGRPPAQPSLFDALEHGLGGTEAVVVGAPTFPGLPELDATDAFEASVSGGASRLGTWSAATQPADGGAVHLVLRRDDRRDTRHAAGLEVGGFGVEHEGSRTQRDAERITLRLDPARSDDRALAEELVAAARSDRLRDVLDRPEVATRLVAWQTSLAHGDETERKASALALGGAIASGGSRTVERGMHHGEVLAAAEGSQGTGLSLSLDPFAATKTPSGGWLDAVPSPKAELSAQRTDAVATRQVGERAQLDLLRSLRLTTPGLHLDALGEFLADLSLADLFTDLPQRALDAVSRHTREDVEGLQLSETDLDALVRRAGHEAAWAQARIDGAGTGVDASSWEDLRRRLLQPPVDARLAGVDPEGAARSARLEAVAAVGALPHGRESLARVCRDWSSLTAAVDGVATDARDLGTAVAFPADHASLRRTWDATREEVAALDRVVASLAPERAAARLDDLALRIAGLVTPVRALPVPPRVRVEMTAALEAWQEAVEVAWDRLLDPSCQARADGRRPQRVVGLERTLDLCADEGARLLSRLGAASGDDHVYGGPLAAPFAELVDLMEAWLALRRDLRATYAAEAVPEDLWRVRPTAAHEARALDPDEQAFHAHLGAAGTPAEVRALWSRRAA